jgi:hypothetical protein
MELLIPGLILVGLMVYLSTRIKKSAAEAFEPETIETSEFSIAKSEGFLHPLNSDSVFEFEAYTKEFGEDDARKIRHARAELTVNENATFAEVLKSARGAVDKVLREENIKQGGGKICILDAEGTQNGVEMAFFHKIVDNGGKVYDLRFAVLDEQKDEYLRRIEEMRDSFTVK